MCTLKNTAEILLNQGGSLLQFHPIRPCYKTNNHINELITERYITDRNSEEWKNRNYFLANTWTNSKSIPFIPLVLNNSTEKFRN